MWNKLSLYKTITWRFIDSFYTFLIVWIVTGQIELAGLIFVLIGVGEMILYYFHEIFWNKIKKE